VASTKRPISDAERKRAIRMRNAGKSYREIAAALGRPIGTISNVLSLAILEGQVDYAMNLDPDVRRKSM
jgi:DNA-directed RNA polymerase specialized sigma24 family protein